MEKLLFPLFVQLDKRVYGLRKVYLRDTVAQKG